MKVKILISIFIFTTSSLFAKINHWKIVLAHGDTISNVSLQQLDKDSLTISCEGFTKSIPIDSIMELRKPRTPNSLKGVGIGTLKGMFIGGILGLMIGSATKYSSAHSSDNSFNIDFGPGLGMIGGGLVGGVAGFFVGGIIGSCDKDKVYDLSQKTHVQKYNTIKWIISKES